MKIQDKDRYREQRREPERSFMRKDSREFQDVARQAAPKGWDGPWNEEESKGSEGLLDPCLENKGNHLVGELWRRAPDQELVEKGGGLPGLSPITVEPSAFWVMDGW